MNEEKQQIVERLKKANNVLVTVSKNPSIDQLAACIGLSLALNKLDKHASAVFSGDIPASLAFLQPEETLEKNTDSLRDFIISLDKSKADKLRYKVEDKIVRIFITPYRTSITDKDLDFSQGDFNVDVVLGLGVHEQGDLDEAILAHGRILHDATVVTINNGDHQSGTMGTINWLQASVSSLGEMITMLVETLGKDLLDEQIATALLTGIVAETNRFSNEKTSAETMKASAALMAAGANQQLVASKLQPTTETVTPDTDIPPAEAPKATKDDPGTLTIKHEGQEDTETKANGQHTDEPANDTPETLEDRPMEAVVPESTPQAPVPELQLPPQPSDSETPPVVDAEEAAAAQLLPPAKPKEEPHIKLNTQKPLLAPEHYENPRTALRPDDDPDRPAFSTALDPEAGERPSGAPAAPLNLPPLQGEAPPLPSLAEHHNTLEEIERELHSTHVTDGAAPKVVPQSTPAPAAKPVEELNLSELQRPAGLDEAAMPQLDAARDAVAQAMAADTGRPAAPEPITALNAQPLGDTLHPQAPAVAPATSEPLLPPVVPPPQPDPATMPTAEQPITMPLPPMPPPITPRPSATNPSTPPPVPPPFMPPAR